MFVEVVWSGAWLGIEEGSAIYSRSEGGNVSPPELSRYAANGNEKLQCEGGKCSASMQELSTLMDEHMT